MLVLETGKMKKYNQRLAKKRKMATNTKIAEITTYGGGYAAYGNIRRIKNGNKKRL